MKTRLMTILKNKRKKISMNDYFLIYIDDK